MGFQNYYKRRIFIFITLAFFSFVVSIFSIVNINSSVTKHKELENIIALSKEVKYYDEVLTMSSRMALYQNTSYWNDRYYKYVKKLDDVIVKIKKNMPIIKNKLLEVNETNIKLVELEEKALTLAVNNKHEEARRLVFSTEYQKLKKAYKHSLDEALSILNKEAVKIENNFTQNIVFSSFVALFSIILIFALSYYVLKYLSNYNKTLQDEVKSQVKKLTEQDVLLIEQSKLASLGEMLESIAHQWRQPLNSISTSVSGIEFRKRFNDLDDEALEHSLSNISNATQHLATTIEVFREFYKDSSQKEFSLKNMLLKVQTLLSSKFKHKEILVLDETIDYRLIARENELVQVVINIISNALEELDKVQDKQRIIKLETSSNEEFISLEISDNAGGIDKDIIEKVFDYKFSTKKDKNGTGIGLYMSKLIMKKSKGSISVTNKDFDYEGEAQRGACFKLDIKK